MSEQTKNNEVNIKFQVFAATVIGGFGGINIGAVLAFSAIFLPQLPDDVTLSQRSWIASICNLGQLVGSLAAGFIANALGRKRCVLLFTIPLICGWLLLIFESHNLIITYIARIVQGFGMLPSISQVYLTEILSVEQRDSLGSTLAISISVGISLTYVIGALFHWVIVAWIFIGIATLMCVGLYFIPESPYWLVQQDYMDEARDTIKILRGNSNYDPDEELQALKEAFESNNVNDEETSENLWKEFLKPYAYKPLLLLVCLWTFQQFSGNYAVVFYAVDIFEGISHMSCSMMKSTTTSNISAILVGFIRILGGILGILFLKKQVSRRLLMTWSSLGMTLAMILLAITEVFKTDMENELHEVPLYLTILLVFGSSTFIMFHGIGFQIIPMLLVGELCPVRLKSLTSGITITCVAIMVFTVVKMFPIAMAYIGASATYTFFAIICFSGGVFSYFFVPETNGKSINEIQNMYRNADENEKC